MSFKTRREHEWVDLTSDEIFKGRSVVVFSLVDGQLVKASTTPLTVSKIGAEAEIFDFAHQWSALYGVIAILIALMAGWLAHIAFRRA